MTDELTPTADGDVCSICGLAAMVTFHSAVLPIEQATAGAACPFHVDAVLARIQEALHETMAAYEGVLRDWWEALYPPPEEAP